MKRSILLFLFLSLSLFGGIQETSFSRADGSRATAYISTPDDHASFPLVVYIDGSLEQSVNNNFSVLSLLFHQGHIGVVAIEKRGITKGQVHQKEFDAHDFYESRLHDYMQFIAELKLPHWNGQMIIIGSSEGGKIAPKLSLHFAHQTMGTILIGSGGGIPFGEEIRYQIKELAKEYGIKVDEKALDEMIDSQYHVMLSHPKSLEKFYDKTYQWFASYLKYNVLEDLLQINTPILMIHGALDTHIPVQSADAVDFAFDQAGKGNLTYYRPDDLGHSISKRMDIFALLLSYSLQHFQTAAEAHHE